MTTPEQHAEVCIAILNHIALEDGVRLMERDELGLHRGLFGCLLCELYYHCDDNTYNSECPGHILCKRNKHDTRNNIPREAWVRAYRYHAGRAK